MTTKECNGLGKSFSSKESMSKDRFETIKAQQLKTLEDAIMVAEQTKTDAEVDLAILRDLLSRAEWLEYENYELFEEGEDPWEAAERREV